MHTPSRCPSLISIRSADRGWDNSAEEERDTFWARQQQQQQRRLSLGHSGSGRGGLYYFLDAEGYSPCQLEWSQKLWWPHCEAMVAYSLLYRYTGEAAHLKRFTQVCTTVWLALNCLPSTVCPQLFALNCLPSTVHLRRFTQVMEYSMHTSRRRGFRRAGLRPR